MIILGSLHVATRSLPANCEGIRRVRIYAKSEDEEVILHPFVVHEKKNLSIIFFKLNNELFIDEVDEVCPTFYKTNIIKPTAEN